MGNCCSRKGAGEYDTGIPISKTKHGVGPKTLNLMINNETASYDTVIPIDDILNGDEKTLKLLQKCLMARGWVKIKYAESVNIVIKDVMDNINKWLLEIEKTEKLQYSLKLGSGDANPQSEYSYNTINGFKEGLRILTGDIYKIHYKNNKYPAQIEDDILKINNVFDELSLKIMKIIYNKIYSLNSYKEFGTIYDISLLNENKFKFSMLDFVNYFNDKQYIEKIRNDDGNNETELKPNVLKTDFNVFEHIDPGLFALSFLSTNIGLEMYDYLSDEWIKIGLNEGIWWNGKTATKIDSNMKAGKHRVMIDKNQYKSRFTGWYEVSCNKQLNEKIMKEAIEMNMDNDINYNDNNDNDNDTLHIKEYIDGIPMSKDDSMDFDHGGLSLDVVHNAEYNDGIPMSKSPMTKTRI